MTASATAVSLEDLRQKVHDEAAQAGYVRALEAAQRRGDLAAQAAALTALGDLYLAYAQAEEALTMYQQAEACARQAGAGQARLRLLRRLGELWWEGGQPSEALACAWQAFRQARGLQCPLGQLDALANLGARYTALGHPLRATELLWAAVQRVPRLVTRANGDSSQREAALQQLLRVQGLAEALGRRAEVLPVLEPVLASLLGPKAGGRRAAG